MKTYKKSDFPVGGTTGLISVLSGSRPLVAIAVVTFLSSFLGVILGIKLFSQESPELKGFNPVLLDRHVEEQTPSSMFPGCESVAASTCASARADFFLMARCLQKEITRVSSECQKSIRHINVVVLSCEDELRRHCSDVKLGGGRQHECLKKFEMLLGEECKKAIYPPPPLSPTL